MGNLQSLITPDVMKVLTPPGRLPLWHEDLERFLNGEDELSRENLREASVEAIQRLLIFLGYSTTSRGAFKVDGDFGMGTNRGIAQFQLEQGINDQFTLEKLAYPCSWQNAHKKLASLEQAVIDYSTLEAMAKKAGQAIRDNEVLCGDFNIALEHLNMLQTKSYYTCRDIAYHYGDYAHEAVERISNEGKKVDIRWVLAIIRQETAGIIRPRFEQHIFSRTVKKQPNDDFRRQRFQSMSLGLGQVMGNNYKVVGAESPESMYYSPINEQVYFVAKFLSKREESVGRKTPGDEDFHTVARYYNGSGYKKHDYHNSLKRWFREFSKIT